MISRAAASRTVNADSTPLRHLLLSLPEVRVTAKLFIGNLPYTVTEDEIEELLNQAGFVRVGEEEEEEPQGEAGITSIRVVRDRDTGLSRGFGFVEMTSLEEAKEARARLLENNASLNGRTLVIDLAKPSGGGTAGGRLRR
jgi:RNA recognition motif-containing protein